VLLAFEQHIAKKEPTNVARLLQCVQHLPGNLPELPREGRQGREAVCQLQRRRKDMPQMRKQEGVTISSGSHCSLWWASRPLIGRRHATRPLSRGGADCKLAWREQVKTPMDKPSVVKVEGAEIDLRVDASLAPSVLRAFAGVTPMDAEVDALAIPMKPFWLRSCIRVLRWYRRRRPPQIGRRCVFDPSCSRYAELAFRHHGFFRGALATLGRLCRCRPGAGGVDLP